MNVSPISFTQTPLLGNCTQGTRFHTQGMWAHCQGQTNPQHAVTYPRIAATYKWVTYDSQK